MSDLTKFCSKCQRVLPVDEFYKSNRTDDGLREYCIDCQYVYKGRPRPPRKLIAPPGMKYCTRCHKLLPATLDYFNQNLKQSSGLAPACRECRMKERRGQPESDKSRRKRQQYRKEHKREGVERAQRWAKDNPERARRTRRITVIRYRARKRELPDNFSIADWNRALDYFGNRCAVCGRPRGFWHTLAMDHWIPLASPNCPGTIPGNIIPLCQGQNGCNNSKSDRDPVEWLRQYFPRRTKQILSRIEAYFASLKE